MLVKTRGWSRFYARTRAEAALTCARCATIMQCKDRMRHPLQHGIGTTLDTQHVQPHEKQISLNEALCAMCSTLHICCFHSALTQYQDCWNSCRYSTSQGG